MAAAGFNYDPVDLRRKYEGLYSQYKEAKDNNMLSGWFSFNVVIFQEIGDKII